MRFYRHASTSRSAEKGSRGKYVAIQARQVDGGLGSFVHRRSNIGRSPARAGSSVPRQENIHRDRKSEILSRAYTGTKRSSSSSSLLFQYSLSPYCRATINQRRPQTIAVIAQRNIEYGDGGEREGRKGCDTDGKIRKHLRPFSDTR